MMGRAVHIVSFSGGKDSTAMLLMMIERGIPVDRVIYVDTTKEFPAMYRHIAMVSEMIRPLEIEIAHIDFDYWFGEHVKVKGKRVGEKGYGWPNMRIRWCTRQKIDVFKKTLVSEQKCARQCDCCQIRPQIIEFHGIAFDERKRCSRNKGRDIHYPLVDWGVTEREALAYCYSRGLDWGGLYEKFNRVSCWCCPLNRISGMRVLYNEFPELWSELVEMDKKSVRKFRQNYSVSDLSERFAAECSRGRLSLW